MQRDLSLGQMVEYLELAASVLTADEMRNHLVFCDW